MDISPLAAASRSQGSAADTAANKATLDYDTFLTLLVEQMKNQDPTDPMDSTEQIAQLATFSQVEQTIQTNKHLEELLQSSSLSQAGSLIGRTITSNDETVSGTIEEVQVYSDGLVAVLEDGTKVVVGPGVSIR
ncbi:Flagellar hook capping protein [Hoeflea phototrophica DFL-43]|jgi:flagellar basal-body rod modification protein FlgD|uniref:Basal-body rod modification protein FlgD n=1 Tax=Hoeflea phototrophica (strain DSM 17068 / NCIMB 14078 / DFL-43) TaxID=411684 RepID=A9CYP9_HOEPD|nr:flagellar hook assembly protein FlgD [Hoeflea phototrophica]EDQ34609.1 Flagellar hook capping protein [Hoeflea phototrophica DFL-43]